MDKRLALVTGGSGFIGSHLATGLLDAGYRVRVLDDLSTGDRRNLEGIADRIELVDGDILDERRLRSSLQGVSIVFHEAAIPSVARSVLAPVRSHQANATGTLMVLCAARDEAVGRVVYASSSSVYGGAHPLPVRESFEPRPLSPYAVSKLAGELYSRAFWASFGLPTIALRYFNVFGPRQDPDSEYAAVIPRFATALMEGRRPVLFGDGTQSRDFTYVDNVVRANLLAAEAGEEAFGRAFNIAHGERHSLLELLELLRSSIGAGGEGVDRAEPRVGDVRHSQADISAAVDILGYRPVVSFEDGVERTVAWLRNRDLKRAMVS